MLKKGLFSDNFEINATKSVSLYFSDSTCTNDKCVGTCDDGWEKHGNHCYLWGTEPPFKAWTEAEDFCQEEGGHLASVGSNEIMDYIILGLRRRGFGDRDWFWLGGNDIEKEGVWKWTDCTPWELSFWAPGEPTNSHGYEDCLWHRTQINNWNDVNCGCCDFAALCSKKICSNKGTICL